MIFPDWDWGKLGNAKLRGIFGIKPEEKICDNVQAEYFIDYLLNEKTVEDLVGLVLAYAPTDVLLGIADAIGSFEVEKEQP